MKTGRVDGKGGQNDLLGTDQEARSVDSHGFERWVEVSHDQLGLSARFMAMNDGPASERNGVGGFPLPPGIVVASDNLERHVLLFEPVLQLFEVVGGSRTGSRRFDEVSSDNEVANGMSIEEPFEFVLSLKKHEGG